MRSSLGQWPKLRGQRPPRTGEEEMGQRTGPQKALPRQAQRSNPESHQRVGRRMGMHEDSAEESGKHQAERKDSKGRHLQRGQGWAQVSEKSKRKPKGALAKEGVNTVKVDKWLRQGVPGISFPFPSVVLRTRAKAGPLLRPPSTGVGRQQSIFALLLMGAWFPSKGTCWGLKASSGTAPL